jgi:hypothetical protein
MDGILRAWNKENSLSQTGREIKEEAESDARIG